LKHYKKPTSFNVFNNLNSETPKTFKISSLIGSIYRINVTTSNDNELKKGLNELKNNFINNIYPKTWIEQKVTEIKNRDFKKKDKKIGWKK
jgi:restriction endonuclease S subunit